MHFVHIVQWKVWAVFDLAEVRGARQWSETNRDMPLYRSKDSPDSQSLVRAHSLPFSSSSSSSGSVPPSGVCILSPWKLGESLTHSLPRSSCECVLLFTQPPPSLPSSPSPAAFSVSHRGREQPSLLGVGGSLARLLGFLCQLGGALVGVRRRLAASSVL